jgi:glutamate-5-semialdehyde dehydrogenase
MRQLIRLKQGAAVLRQTPSAVKNQALKKIAAALSAHQDSILKANNQDLRLSQTQPAAFQDRLQLTPKRLRLMQDSLLQVADLPDPVGEEVEKKTLANGLLARRVRSPLGIVFLIFESRPNVAIEAFSLGFKSGNGMILRGGRESSHTTKIIYKVIAQALKESKVDSDCFWGISDPDRQIVKALLARNDFIDVVVPRGGEGLIRFIMQNTSIPIIKNDRGLCHVYVHADADLKMAARIVVNAKCQRPSVCNSLETLLVHDSVAHQLLPSLAREMSAFNMQWFVCPMSRKILRDYENVKAAKEINWNTEYNDFKINCRVVSSLDSALAHIDKYGSRHSESIVTGSEPIARRFQNEADAAAVYWNASTRFTDGFELGLGGELGISTQKLHVRGPVGLRELTSARWIIDGNGQIRG